MDILEGKQALVTGAGRGIGKGCALELAKRGASVVVNDRPDSPDLEETASAIRALGRDCTVIEADVFSRPGCQKLVEQAVQAVNRLDILVSNPAVSIRGDFLDYSPDDFETVINGALVSGFHMSQLVARHMVEQGAQGKIVFISSVHAPRPYARNVAYNAAKAGLNNMARTIAVELARYRINVNIIEPGWIDTPGEHSYFGSERLKKEALKLPWARLGTPQDIGRAAAFLASEEADYISGTVVRVDGAIALRDCIEEV
jgi:glucose 1-dehydrogenase